MHDDSKLLEQRWGMAQRNAGFGVWDLDVPGDRVHYSPEWKALLGYEVSAEPDRTAVWRSRVHPDDLQPMLDALFGHLAGRGPGYEKEFRLRAANGRYRWVMSRGRVVERDATGRALRMVGTLTDLTERREAESQRSAHECAEAADRARHRFLARMSHELRTPLNAVLGFAQLMQARLGSADLDEQRRYLSHVEKAGWHLLALIDDVLDLSRIETGALDVRIEPVALLPLLGAVIEEHAASALARGIRLRLAPPAAPPPEVLADAKRLQQVVAKLLGNAIRFNRDGGGVAIEVVEAGAHWQVSIVDTGIGIAAAQLPYLFEPFERPGDAASVSDGVGIGLMLARRLVEAMGGSLVASSVEGAGSTFTFTMPAQRA